MVEKKEIFRKVGEIINELNEQYRDLSKSPDHLNELEVELFAANANFLANHIKIIQKLNSTKDTPLLKPASETEADPEEDIAVKEQKPEASAENKPEGKTKAPKQEEEAGPDEESFKFELNEKPAEDIDSVEEEKTGESEHESVPEGTVVNEVVIRERTISVDTPAKDTAEHVPSLNDVMASQLDQNTVAGKFNRQPVADLKAIVSLNDKLLFVKDLFNSYSLAYSEAIELLNRFDNFESADNFLKTNYAVKNNWSEKQSTVDKFYEILNRRFTK